jgi:hypothetical protein
MTAGGADEIRYVEVLKLRRPNYVCHGCTTPSGARVNWFAATNTLWPELWATSARECSNCGSAHITTPRPNNVCRASRIPGGLRVLKSGRIRRLREQDCLITLRRKPQPTCFCTPVGSVDRRPGDGSAPGEQHQIACECSALVSYFGLLADTLEVLRTISVDAGSQED